MGDPGIERIELLLDYLAESKNVKSLLDKLNHPMIDMVLDWLVRDLSYAFDHKEEGVPLKESEKDLRHRSWVGGGDKWVRFFLWHNLFGVQKIPSKGIYAEIYSVVDHELTGITPPKIYPVFLFVDDRAKRLTEIRERTRSLLLVPSSINHVDLLIRKDLAG